MKEYTIEEICKMTDELNKLSARLDAAFAKQMEKFENSKKD